MAAINTQMGSSLLKFIFTDDDGEVFASFRMNPADVKLAQRCQEVSEFFHNIENKIPENAELDDVVKFNDELEDKVCYLLGYNAKQNLFGLVSATSIMEDGNLFVVHVVNTIIEAIGPELRKRKQTVAAAVAKHTAKYQ